MSSTYGWLRQGAALAVLCGMPMLVSLAQSGGESVVFVAIIDHAGKPVAHLSGEAFHVWEDGASRTVVSATPATDPPSIVVIVHGVTREDGTLDVRKGLGALVDEIRRLSPDARVALTTEVRTPALLNVTSDAAELDKTTSRFAMSGANLIFLEAVQDACRALAKETTRRRIVIAITNSLKNDGAAEHADQAVAMLKSAGVSLWTINFVPGSNRQNLNVGMNNEKDNVLTMWTTVSGGRNDQVFGTTSLAARAAAIVDVVMSQYAVRYRRPPGIGQASLRIGVAGADGPGILAPRWSLK